MAVALLFSMKMSLFAMSLLKTSFPPGFARSMQQLSLFQNARAQKAFAFQGRGPTLPSGKSEVPDGALI
jgi:hypothetical protein